MKRHAVVGLRSCRAGSYFRYAAKVTKGAPKEEENPFMAGFLPPLESSFFPADRGTPPGCARGLTARVAFGLFARRWSIGIVYTHAAVIGWRNHCIKKSPQCDFVHGHSCGRCPPRGVGALVLSMPAPRGLAKRQHFIKQPSLASVASANFPPRVARRCPPPRELAKRKIALSNRRFAPVASADFPAGVARRGVARYGLISGYYPQKDGIISWKK